MDLDLLGKTYDFYQDKVIETSALHHMGGMQNALDY